MSRIEQLHGRQILDSRGIPTVEVEVALGSGARARASVASGGAPGPLEAVELRDGDDAWLGRGVNRALDGIALQIAPAVQGRDAADQRGLDAALIDLDGTPNKARLGANAVLAVSLAVAKAAAADVGEPLWRSLSNGPPGPLPVPLMNLIHGGPTAPSPLDIQEFMIVPHGAATFTAALRMGVEVYQTLKRQLAGRGLQTAVGDEGGFCPALHGTAAPIDALMDAVLAAGYTPGSEVALALDAGASALRNDHCSAYVFWQEQRILSASDVVRYWEDVTARYPVVSIEDGMDENDWAGWRQLTTKLGSAIQLVGDDVFVSDIGRLREGVAAGVANAILVKPNQVGTLTETLDVIAEAQAAGYACVLSHRSGDTDDQTIADLAIATRCTQIKAGAPARGERTGRYNHLMRIEEQLGEDARYAGREALRR